VLQQRGSGYRSHPRRRGNDHRLARAADRQRLTFANGDFQFAHFELKVVELRFVDQFKNVQDIIFREFHDLDLSTG
jgi:hypothetical protein